MRGKRDIVLTRDGNSTASGSDTNTPADPATMDSDSVRSEIAALQQVGRSGTLTPEQVERGNALLDRAEALDAEGGALSFNERAAARTDAAHQRQVEEGRDRLARSFEQNRASIEGNGSDRDGLDEDQIRGRSGEHRSTRQDPWDIDALQRVGGNADEIHARAASAVEQTPGISDQRREALSLVLERGEGDIAEMIVRTTSPEYKAAFGIMLRDGGGQHNLTPEQARAVQAVEPLRRAMSTATNGAGGYLIPTDIEPSVTMTTDGASNAIMQLARRVSTTGNTYRVVNSPAAAWSWDAQNTEVSDDATTLTNTDITLHNAQALVPMSITSTVSAMSAMSIANQVLADGYDELTSAAVTTGTGSGQPIGIITALDGSASEVAPTTAETFAVADVYKVFEAMSKRHRTRARWMSNIAIQNDIRQFADDDGNSLLARLGDGEVQQMLGRAYDENEDMDDGFDAAATADNFLLLLANWQHYVIAEGIGTLVEVLPHIFGSNGRPIGARGVYAATRFGADSVLDSAFRLLNVATAA